MTMALAVPETQAPVVTQEQIALIKQTVAREATDAELRLFLFDCARQGVHPLDKLLHFTKRGGKYTPVTSIDLMRTRAADTGEYAGSDDAVFPPSPYDSLGGPESATVTVWRLVQGTRCAFTATARWSEYYPGDAGGHMWKKMPHTMLAKCAEALALRKGFPRQLAGLYAKEEMDQAERTGYTVEPTPAPSAALPPRGEERRENPVAQSGGELTGTMAPPVHLPAGAVVITKVEAGWAKGKAKGFLHHSGQAVGADGIALFRDELVTLASEVCQSREPVLLSLKTSEASGKVYCNGIERARASEPELPPFHPVDDIPF